jgi:hypothetical protein
MILPEDYYGYGPVGMLNRGIPYGYQAQTAQENKKLGPFGYGILGPEMAPYWQGNQFVAPRFKPPEIKLPELPKPPEKPTSDPDAEAEKAKNDRRLAALEEDRLSRMRQFEGDSGGHAGDPDFGTATPGGNEEAAGKVTRAVMGLVSPVGTGLLSSEAINSSEAARSEKANLANSAYNDDMMNAPTQPNQQPEDYLSEGVVGAQQQNAAEKSAPVQSGPTAAQMTAAQETRAKAQAAFQDMDKWRAFLMNLPVNIAPMIASPSPVAAAPTAEDYATAAEVGFNPGDLGYGIGAAPGGIGVTGPTEYNGPQVSPGFADFMGPASGDPGPGPSSGDPGAVGGTDADPGQFRDGGPIPMDKDKMLEARKATVHEGEMVLRPEATAYFNRRFPGLLNKMNKMGGHGILGMRG